MNRAFITICFKTFLQHEFVNHNFLFCHNNFCGHGFKHIVLHAKISFYFSHGRVYTDKIAIESEMTDL